MDIRVAGGGGGGFLNNGVQVGGLGGVAAGSLQVVPGDHFTVDVGCDGNSSSPGALTFTATAQPTAGVPGTPTGTVGFSVENGAPLIGVDGKPLTQPVGAGEPRGPDPGVDQSKLTFGTHTVVAAYSGDGQFQAATTNVDLFVVNFNVGGASPAGLGERWSADLCRTLHRLGPGRNRHGRAHRPGCRPGRYRNLPRRGPAQRRPAPDRPGAAPALRVASGRAYLRRGLRGRPPRGP